MTTRMRHWYCNEWYQENEETPDIKSVSQEELQDIARMIRRGCEIMEISHGDMETVTIYGNSNLHIMYWIHDNYGHISTIDEARNITF